MTEGPSGNRFYHIGAHRSAEEASLFTVLPVYQPVRGHSLRKQHLRVLEIIRQKAVHRYYRTLLCFSQELLHYSCIFHTWLKAVVCR